jgi:hypothetical protein
MIAEGDGGEVHGGVGGGNSVRPGAAEVRARGHQGASQDDTLPSYPGAYGDPCHHTVHDLRCSVLFAACHRFINLHWAALRQ